MILYACHPEVVMDPAVPVPRWHLSDAGVHRMRAFAAALQRPDAVWASTECKAIEAAGILAARFGLPVQVHPGLDENNRSSTGYSAGAVPSCRGRLLRGPGPLLPGLGACGGCAGAGGRGMGRDR